MAIAGIGHDNQFILHASFTGATHRGQRDKTTRNVQQRRTQTVRFVERNRRVCGCAAPPNQGHVPEVELTSDTDISK